MKILVINPGSTSTKIAVYENETPLFVSNIKHSVEELSAFPEVIDQFEFRKNLVLQELENNKIPFSFDAIIGRGGLVKPIPGGVYEVNEAMKRDTVHAMRTHACNLGGLIASELASTLPDCPAFIADPGVVDAYVSFLPSAFQAASSYVKYHRHNILQGHLFSLPLRFLLR